MNSYQANRTISTAISVAACGVLAAGIAGYALLSSHTAHRSHKAGPMLLAPMIGVIDSCVMAQQSAVTQNLADLQAACTGPNGSAAALVESTLSALQPHGKSLGTYPLGYTLPVPLLQLFRPSSDGWVINHEPMERLARTVRDTDRPLILYLFSTHFSTDAPLEKALATDPANLAQTRDGPLAQGRYYDSALNNWTFANTQTELTARRVQATKALLDAMCQLPAQDIAKIKGVTLLAGC